MEIHSLPALAQIPGYVTAEISSKLAHQPTPDQPCYCAMFQMKGRVHITEVTDDPLEGETPLKPFKHGETLSVKLIGFR